MGKASFYFMVSGIAFLIVTMILFLSEDKDGSLGNIGLLIMPVVAILLMLSVIFGYISFSRKTNHVLGAISALISLIILILCSVMLYQAAL